MQGLDNAPTLSHDLPRKNHPTRVPTMSKKPSKHGPNKAKSIVAQPPVSYTHLTLPTIYSV